jgi:hypothetical protein
LTLGTGKIGDLVSNWPVTDETSLSDHRYILFQVGNLEISRTTYRNIREPIGNPIGKTYR